MSEKYNLLEKIIKKLRKSVSTEEQNFTEEEKDRIRKNIGALSDATNTLPNPNKLIFTGAFTGEYDGSNELLVAIPTGENSGTSGVHVGPDEPTDPAVSLWLDTDEVRTTTHIKTPETAEVGQTVVVKAVDENGKPTEWEAADFPEGGSGGGGATETLVASYTHSGNLEVVVSSIDYDTGTITAVGHGLSENDMIYATQNWDVDDLKNPEAWLPTGMLYGSRYYAVNVTTDTFQISTTKSGTAATLSTNGSANFSRWHFERDTDPYGSSITLKNLGTLTNFAVRIFGKGLKNGFFYSTISALGYGYFSTAADGLNVFDRFIGDGNWQGGDILFSVKSKVQYDKTLGRYFLDREGFCVMNKKGSNYVVQKTALDAHGVSKKMSPIAVTGMTFWNCYPANGTIVEVYKL